MLFDLRSRGRRQAVRVIYLFLALVMVAGLVLVGVGTGSSGGLLNAFTNNGSGSGGSQINDQALNQAIKAVKKHPTASNWAALMQARWSDAGSGSNYNSTSGTYTASGKKQLRAGADAWQQYLKVTGSKPSMSNSFLAADIYQNLQQYSDEATAWNYAAEAQGAAQSPKPLLCLALSSYAAKLTSKGDLAAAAAVKLEPKLQQLSLKSALQSAKASPTTAASDLVQEGC